jgi:hypothetical protein
MSSKHLSHHSLSSSLMHKYISINKQLILNLSTSGIMIVDMTLQTAAAIIVAANFLL